MKDFGHIPLPALPGSTTPTFVVDDGRGEQRHFIWDDWQLGHGPHFDPLNDTAELEALARYPKATAILMRLGLTIALEISTADCETFGKLQTLARRVCGDTPLVARYSLTNAFLFFQLERTAPLKKFIRSNLNYCGNDLTVYGFGHALPAAGKTPPVAWDDATPLDVVATDLPIINLANISDFLAEAALLLGADPSIVRHDLAPAMPFYLQPHDYWLTNAHAYVANTWPIVPIEPHGKRPAKPARGDDGLITIPLSDWQNFHYDPVEHNCRRYQGFGIGLRLGEKTGLIAIDCDADDEKTSNAARETMIEALGPSPLIRRGRFPRWTAIYRFQGVLPVRSSGIGTQKVEYNFSSQTVLEGIHPSGEPYRWFPDAKSLADIKPCDLPLLTGEQIAKLHSALTEGDGSHPPLLKSAPENFATPLPSIPPAEQQFQKGIREAVEAALECIPNTAETSWEQWNRMGLLIGVALDWGTDALQLFEAWSGRSPKHGQKKMSPAKWFDAEIRNQQRGRADYSKVGGARSIYGIAAEHGFNRHGFAQLYPDWQPHADPQAAVDFETPQDGPSTDVFCCRSSGEAKAIGEATGLECLWMGADLPAGRRLVFLMSDESVPEQAISNSIQNDNYLSMFRKCTKNGVNAIALYPRDQRRFDGQTWTTKLQNEGADAVVDRLRSVTGHKEPAPKMAISEARAKLTTVVRSTVGEILNRSSSDAASHATQELKNGEGLLARLCRIGDEGNKTYALKVGVGIGKTTALIDAIVECMKLETTDAALASCAC